MNSSELLEFLTTTFCFTSGMHFIMPILVIGFFFLKREIYGKALILLLFAMVFNALLKSIFKVPLPPGVGKDWWYAFPSGHMLTAVVLWGSLAWDYKNKFIATSSLVLISGIGFSLVYKGYHYPIDIAGAIGFGVLYLLSFNVLLKKSKWLNSNLPYLSLGLAIISLPIIFSIPQHPRLDQLWLSLGALIGFPIGWMLSDYVTKNRKPSVYFNALSFIIAAIGIVMLEIASKSLTKSPTTIFIHYFLLTFWISGIPSIISHFTFSRKRSVKAA